MEMTKYLVFYDEAEHSDRPPPTGLEAMACAIAEASIAKRRHKKYFKKINFLKLFYEIKLLSPSSEEFSRLKRWKYKYY